VPTRYNGTFPIQPRTMTDKRPTLSLTPKTRSASAKRPAAGRAQGKPDAPKARPQTAKAAPAPNKAPATPTPPRATHDAPKYAEPAPRLRQGHEVRNPAQLDFRPGLKPDSLAFALLGAASALARVRQGAALPQALGDVFDAYGALPQARGAIQDIAYRALRQLGRSETLLGLMTSKAPEPAMLSGLLVCALALLDPPEGAQAPYEAFTVVDQAVGAAPR
jgi:16S rRNA (cytosine967-C5)-methyltransferase